MGETKEWCRMDWIVQEGGPEVAPPHPEKYVRRWDRETLYSDLHVILIIEYRVHLEGFLGEPLSPSEAVWIGSLYLYAPGNEKRKPGMIVVYEQDTVVFDFLFRLRRPGIRRSGYSAFNSASLTRMHALICWILCITNLVLTQICLHEFHGLNTARVLAHVCLSIPCQAKSFPSKYVSLRSCEIIRWVAVEFLHWLWLHSIHTVWTHVQRTCLLWAIFFYNGRWAICFLSSLGILLGCSHLTTGLQTCIISFNYHSVYWLVVYVSLNASDGTCPWSGERAPDRM